MEDNQGRIKELQEELLAIYTDNYPKLYACVFRMTGNHQDAEDVLQNTFVKAYQHIEEFREDSKLYSWVYRIILNEGCRYFEYIKKLPLIRITEEREITESEFFSGLNYIPDFEDNLIIDEMREKCLQGFLKCLSRNQRVCFLFKNFLELKNQDIAEILGISANNVKITLYRCRKNLQEMFHMRCNLIDPAKPCKCHLWIKYMRDHNLPLPDGYHQIKSEDLKREYFKNMDTLRKIEHLYYVQTRISREEFLNKLKEAAEIL